MDSKEHDGDEMTEEEKQQIIQDKQNEIADLVTKSMDVFQALLSHKMQVVESLVTDQATAQSIDKVGSAESHTYTKSSL